MSGYVAALNVRFMNLCVKAEEMSLISVRVNVEGMNQNLENVSVIGKKDDYSFMIVPNLENYLKSVALGIAMVHPDFKQEEKMLNVDAFDANGNPVNQDVPYILVTMPEVDDDRYELLKQAAEYFYQESKTQMDKAFMQTSAQISLEGMGEPAEDLENMAKAIDKLKADKEEQRDKLYSEKLQEIETGHNKWLAEQEKKQGRHSRKNRAGMSLKMGASDEAEG